MSDDDGEFFDWGALGADWWAEALKACRGADVRHAKFACARHGGATLKDAARLAGYSGSNDDRLKSAGAAAERTNAVKELMAMAEAELSGAVSERTWTHEERISELKKMLSRAQDSERKMKLVELIGKEEDRRGRGGDSRNFLLDTDGYGAWRACREHIRLGPLGAASYALVCWAARGPQSVCCAPLLHDIAANCQREAPWLWSRLLGAMRPDERARLEVDLADPDYQREAREKLWGEVDVTIPGSAARGNGAATDKAEDFEHGEAAA